MAAREQLESCVGDPRDRRAVASELDDPVPLRPGDEHRARETGRQLPAVSARLADAAPGLDENRRALRCGRDDALALGTRGWSRKHQAVVAAEGPREPACAARARCEERGHAAGDEPGQRTDLVESSGIDQHDPLVEAKRVDESREQVGVVRGARRGPIVTGAALPRPRRLRAPRPRRAVPPRAPPARARARLAPVTRC